MGARRLVVDDAMLTRGRKHHGATSSDASSDDDSGTFLEAAYGASHEAASTSEMSIVSSTLLAAPRSRVAPMPALPRVAKTTPSAAVEPVREITRKRARTFRTAPPVHVEQQARPPWAPPIGDREAHELVAWQRREVADERALRSLPWYRFAMMVAGRSGTPLDQLVRLRTEERAAPQPREERAAPRPATRLELVDESEKPVPPVAYPATPGGQHARRIDLRNNSDRISSRTGEPRRLASDGYLGVARATGLAFLSPVLLSAIEEALDALGTRYPRVFAHLANETPLIASEDTISRFATLTVAMVVLARYRGRREPQAVSTIAVFERELESALRNFAHVRRTASGRLIYDSAARSRELEARRASMPECYGLPSTMGAPAYAPGPRTRIRSPDDYRVTLAPPTSGAALVNALLVDTHNFAPLFGREAVASPFGGRTVFM